jgi:hypothetical protein
MAGLRSLPGNTPSSQERYHWGLEMQGSGLHAQQAQQLQARPFFVGIEPPGCSRVSPLSSSAPDTIDEAVPHPLKPEHPSAGLRGGICPRRAEAPHQPRRAEPHCRPAAAHPVLAWMNHSSAVAPGDLR